MFAALKANALIIFVAVALVGVGGYYIHRHRETNAMPTKDLSADCEFATLGGGCFWCLEAAYEEVKGVERVESGYMGGTLQNPSYRQVCSGTTGHAEVVQVAFDPKVISYREILEIFFVLHDPTTLNRQGPDSGTQYRSVIFHHSPEQKQTAEKLIAGLAQQKIWDRPIVTQVSSADTFYRAEEYHQGYFRNNPTNSYCLTETAPKVAKLRKTFLSKLKTP